MAASISGARPQPEPRPNSVIASIVNTLVVLCAIVPYALVALVLRFVMARVFFISGQGKVDGPVIPVTLFGPGNEFTVVLPAGIKDATFQLFETQYAGLPVPPTLAAYLFSYAEFVLPICLLLGFATRLSALALLVMTALIQVYVAPAALWSTHAYWIVILLVLMTVGPGALSVDRLIRHVYEK
ncbi:MAG: DoxX family protein [Xanthobacteraceae bacterium]